MLIETPLKLTECGDVVIRAAGTDNLVEGVAAKLAQPGSVLVLGHRPVDRGAPIRPSLSSPVNSMPPAS
jgi:hypothetical protein